ncbi:hypothetical protein C8J55DRAFT_564851 [Lentinula edodes]|uniref:Uncharacterized protein n=1 Tax=Lentinula lateritia TaxID=40482 RepID=A0A9W8ZXL9_9AGAR|nr:hypothetical protein C8J55DRAFT_564851 [Lentinula edodes]
MLLSVFEKRMDNWIHLPNTTPALRYSSGVNTPAFSEFFEEPHKGHHLVVPTTTRSFPSSVAVLVAPFELQPAPSTLQHKPSHTKTYPKTHFDPGLTYIIPSSPVTERTHRDKMSATSTERPSSSKTESKKQKSALSRGNTTQAQKSNQAASSTVITVAAGQRLMSIPEQSLGDETASNIRTPEGRQPEVQGPPPVEPGMGPPQRRYTSMGYAQPASSPMGGFAYSPTWGTRGPPPGLIPQLDMESASNAGGRVSGQVAAIERIQGEGTDPLTVRQQEKLPERRVSPAVSEQSRASSRRLPTPPVQSLNLPPPRRGGSLSSLLKSPAMNTPNWERTHAIHHSRTNFPVQPLSEMTLRLEDVIRIQECIPEDVAMVLREVLESMGIEDSD